jgi:lysophospholipase L1-like esterase
MLFQSAHHVAFFGAQACGQKNGLVARIAERLKSRLDLHIINASHATQTLAVAQQDVAAHRADWYVLWFGTPEALSGGRVQDFQAAYHELLTTLHAQNAKVILCEPVLVEANPDHPDWVAVRQHRQAVLELATQHDLGVVALQNPFHRVLGGTTNTDWSLDRVHLNRAGSALAAEEFLAAIGFEVFEDDDEPAKGEP